MLSGRDSGRGVNNHELVPEARASSMGDLRGRCRLDY